MSNLSLYDELDQAIDRMIANPDATPQNLQPGVAELLDLAADLRQLPRPDFRMRLKVELQWQAMGNPLGKDQDWAPANVPRPAAETEVLPTLFGKGHGAYQMKRANFALSFALHAVALLAMMAAGLMAFQHGPKKAMKESYLVTEIPTYVPPVNCRTVNCTLPDGGGGGGDASKLLASHGQLPRVAREQFVPPVAVTANLHPKLTLTPTIVAPDLKLSLSSQTGDPLSALMNPSNGTGVRGGIGSGTGGGIGSGYGPGYGIGEGGGFGGGVYRVGNGISAPHVIYSPDPEYSDEARKAKFQGVVTLWAIIDADGRPKNLQVARSLGMGLDEKAIEAVRRWRFDPARKGGVAVPVMINVEVDFHLY